MICTVRGVVCTEPLVTTAAETDSHIQWGQNTRRPRWTGLKMSSRRLLAAVSFCSLLALCTAHHSHSFRRQNTGDF